jgi:PPM family protein phosphatase
MAGPTFDSGSYSHVGRRRSNQDSVVVRRLSTGADVVAVADGMGGHSAGEVASSIVLSALIEELENGATLEAATLAANARVFREAQQRTEWQGMGTTLVVLLRTDEWYWIANVGDSRAYAIDANGIRQITLDHSYVAEALRSGTMTEAEAARSPWRNALTRAVGTDETVAVDVHGPFSALEPHAVLLCSDGLYKSVSETLIREYVLSVEDLSTASKALASLAYRRGSDDNITVAAVEFSGLPRRPPTVTLPVAIDIQGKPIAAGPELPAVVRRETPREAMRETSDSHGSRGPAGEPGRAESFDPLLRSRVRRKRKRAKSTGERALKVLLVILILLAAVAAFAGLQMG